MSKQHLILASISKTRRQILTSAGLDFTAMSSPLDEETEKQKLQLLPPEQLALKLAEAKALALSQQKPDCLVIGADQTLILDGQRYSKPKSLDDARAQLWMLRGKTHTLTSALAITKDNGILWHYEAFAQLTMREFSDTFLDEYMDKVSPNVLTSVGGYQIEGLGFQLFSKIEGDYFTIMGLPLLPLLAQLRAMSVITS